MNKKELIARVAVKTGLTKRQAHEAIDVIFDSITEELAAGKKVQLIGFGTFKSVARAARRGRNPQTGELINIPARTVPFFKAGLSLKKTVEEGA